MAGNPLVVGLTGSFGSGCSTLAEALSSRCGFAGFPLSAPLKEAWRKKNDRDPKQAPRGELQDMGNMWAGKKGQDILAQRASRAASKDKPPRIVFDGIKREDEVHFFRDKYPSFCLIAVQCSRDKRWNRVRRSYEAQGLGEREFERDDMRDQIEEVKHGQQVALCVDDADIVINNEDDLSRTGALNALRMRVERYLGLLAGQPASGPSPEEVAMAVAYTQAEASQCIKRHVGAAVVDGDGALVSVGFNENPRTMKTCPELYGHCRKDELITRYLEDLEGKFCPECGRRLNNLVPPFRCRSCGLSLKGHYFPDHGVRWCHAVHAEERALGLVAGADLKGCTLYTTTFPCLNCAKLISDAGIRRVMYVEPYPERESAKLLTQNDIDVVPFEGVKARAFHKLYKPYRRVMEERYRLNAS